MKVTWTGRHIDLSPAQTQKIEAEFAKVGKMLDTDRGEVEARVVLSLERQIHSAEVRVPYYDHELVGAASGADLFVAIHGAVGKLETQAIRVREKWRDGRRTPREDGAAPE